MIDFFRMLHEMKGAGVSNCEVARRMEIHHNTLRNWKMGVGSPKVDEAFRFVMIYCEVVKPTVAQTFVSTTAYKLIVTPAM